MLSKPLSFFLVFVVTAANLVFIFLPFFLVALPWLEISGDYLVIDSNFAEKMVFLFWFVVFLVVSLMIFYLFCDFLFGFSYRNALKNCVNYEKTKDSKFLNEVFKQLQDKFSNDSVRLFIKNSSEINAYAVGSLGRGAIILSRGLINHIIAISPDSKTFLYSIRSILGHEMSHLINKDFLPAYLIITNQKITSFLVNLTRYCFDFLIGFFTKISYIGGFFAEFFRFFYFFVNGFLSFFNRFVVFGVYEFLRRFVSRKIEYRCDRQSAQAFGGKNMAMALSMLGKSGYFTIFSTHPSTSSRCKKVSSVKMKDGLIMPSFVDAIFNGLAFLMIFLLLLYSAKEAHFFQIMQEIFANNQNLYRKLSSLWQLLKKIY